MIDTKIYGDVTTREYEAASELGRRFQNFFLENHEGRIGIFTDIICHNQDPKEIGIFVMVVFKKGTAIRLTSKAKYKRGEEYLEEPMQARNIYLNDFCCVIELKDHPLHKVNFTKNGRAWVETRGKWSSASKQSEGQKHSLRNYFSEHKYYQPFISNLLWFSNLNIDDIPVGEHNFLHGNFDIGFLLEKITRQNFPYKVQGENPYYTLSGLPRKTVALGDFSAIEDFNKLYSFLTEDFVPSNQGRITRQKLEVITQKFIKDQEWAKSIGQAMIIIRGRAGRGKTMRLLRIAFDLCHDKKQRCLILTYNKALVSDIRRLIALSGIGSRPEDNTVAVSTIHSFLHQLMTETGIYTPSDSSNDTSSGGNETDFFKKYPALKAELLDYIKNGAITEADIPLGFDFVLIDEGQDWPRDEQLIITAIAKIQNIMVTDGLDQMVRSNQYAKWDNIKPNIIPDFRDPQSKKFLTLRQEANLVNFINALARQSNIQYDLQANPELKNGRVIISLKAFDKNMYQMLLADCLSNENKHYEMMFLVPPSLVEVIQVKEKNDHVKIMRRFKLAEEYKKIGINLWDGTSSELRSEFPSQVDVHRLFQYDSCRGLESWTLVCLDIDDFFQYKIDTYEVTQGDGQLALKSESELRMEFAIRWLLIAFTRPIDTLFISIRDKNSIAFNLLSKIAKSMPDIVEIVE